MNRRTAEQGTAECRSEEYCLIALKNFYCSKFLVRLARNAFGQILCSAYNVDVGAAIIILTLITLHGRRVFDIRILLNWLFKLARMGLRG